MTPLCELTSQLGQQHAANCREIALPVDTEQLLSVLRMWMHR